MKFAVLHRVTGAGFSNATHVAMNNFTGIETVFGWRYRPLSVKGCGCDILIGDCLLFYIPLHKGFTPIVTNALCESPYRLKSTHIGSRHACHQRTPLSRCQ